MQKYDLVLLLDAWIQEKERQKIIDELQDLLKKNILEKDELWLKKLMYKLSGKNWNDSVYIYSYYIQLDNSLISDLNKFLLFNKIIIRKFLYKMNNSEEFLKFNELQTKFKKIIELFEEKKMLQKISYFSKKENKKYINWKSIEMLKKYITRFGNIKPRKYTKNSVLTQKALRTAILKAREIWLIEYIK